MMASCRFPLAIGRCLPLLLAFAVVHSSYAFQPSNTRLAAASRTPERSLSRRYVVTDRDPEILEMMLGGEKFEMVPLPDRMCDTTIFVGNLCEFVQDDDLSKLFRSVSTLQSVPSCVVRKANMQSLRYGFVSFPTVEEKEAAIIRFHGSEWRGTIIKVEPILDNPKRGRVRVPERMVSYVSGSLKKLRNGQVNSMRNARDSDGQRKRKKKAKSKKKEKIPRARVGASSLSIVERQELDRACKKGFLTLDGRKAGHGSLSQLCTSVSLKGSKLAVAHREWCDKGVKPNIILYKASGRSREVLDHIVVDLSPLRNQVSDKWRSEILDAAFKAGMVLQSAEQSDECEVELEFNSHGSDESISQIFSDAGESRLPVADLPFVSMGFFKGERSNAKAMARELSQLWNLPELEKEEFEVAAKSTHKGGRYQNNHGETRKEITNAKDSRRAKRRKVRKDDWEQRMDRFVRYQ